MGKEPSAHEFAKQFVESYANARKQFNDAQWKDIWSSSHNWNRLMLWRNVKPPDPLEKSVFHRTAEIMNLEYWENEPLKLDGPFYSSDAVPRFNFPFPIIVAFEHENFPFDFGHEVMKLFSVRAPLKVGVTYVWPDPRAGSVMEQIERIHRTIVECFEEIQRVVGEDPTAEYLFLVGSDEQADGELAWYCLTFTAAEKPTAIRFTRAEAA